MSFEMDTKAKKRPKKIGRPLKLGLEEFRKAADKYIADTLAEKGLPTLTGLALRLDIDEDTVTQYGKRPQFAREVKRVKEVGKEVLLSKLMATEKPLINHIFLAKAIAGLRDNTDLNAGATFKVQGVVSLPKRNTKA